MYVELGLGLDWLQYYNLLIQVDPAAVCKESLTSCQTCFADVTRVSSETHRLYAPEDMIYSACKASTCVSCVRLVSLTVLNQVTPSSHISSWQCCTCFDLSIITRQQA